MWRRSDDEAGFTIVEVLVAIVVVVIGAMTTFSLLSAANRNTDRAKASQVALDLAQQELEALRSLNNEELALTASPGHSSDSLDPDYRVSSGKFAVVREPPGTYRKLVVNGGEVEGESEKVIKGGVVQPSEGFETGGVSGTIHRYVVWRNDTPCGSACPTSQDYKQIVVAVKLDTPGNQAGERGYVEAQSNFVDPTDSSEDDPAANSKGELVTAQQFFLTDTPCSSSGSTEREEISGDHLLHNTLGTCASGPQTGTTAGAPDTLVLGSPPDPAPEDTGDPALYDYSDDTYLEPTPDTDKGVQIRRDDTSGCHYVPTGTTNPESQVHRWVTDPMASAFKMTEKVTIEFYTRTLNDALYKGKLCVYLYKRSETGTPPVATDTLLTNKSGGTAYWTYAPEGGEYWPRNSWTKVRLAMTFNEAPYTIPAGDRLGVALSVERNGTPADAIPIMYDHPTYPTRIEVDTSTPIEGE
jgi:prepilin-type N-terminal cleavage/methylation domain-containing protein